MKTETLRAPVETSIVAISDVDTFSAQRDKDMQALFSTDLDYLQETGAFDIFMLDSESGVDGLMHTLLGDEDGGFHSEPAVQILGLNHPSHTMRTAIDRRHLAYKSSKEGREFRERPYEPFAANVVVGGFKKTMEKKHRDNTKTDVKNNMYPNEYDPTAVVRTINIAYENMDPEADKLVATDKGDRIVNDTGWAPMIDETTKMRIRTIMDPATRKVITAYPLVKRSGYLNIPTEEAHSAEVIDRPVSSKKS